MTIHDGTPSSNQATLFSRAIPGLLAMALASSAVAAPGDHAAQSLAPEPGQADQPAGAAFGYLRIAGSTFHPLNNATTYSYPGNGCISKTGGANSLFAHKVVLPQGTVVRFLRLYFFDNSTSAVTAFFTTYDGAGNFIERTSVGSDTTGGYNSSLSAAFSYEVNRADAAINIVANLGAQDDSTLQFCGVRIAYDAPITDRIFANDFDLTPL